MNHSCIICGAHLPEKPLFTLRNAPSSAQNIPDRKELPADTGMELSLYRCEECGLTQFDTEPVWYYRDVIRAGGLSTTMTELRRTQYRHFIEKYHLSGKRILEAGCGRGEFLKVLTEFPVRAYGIEHKAALCKEAQKAGLRVWQDFPEHAQHVIREPGSEEKFDAFLSFNFLEHQPDPSVMLRSIRASITDGGYGLVTVPALEYIVEKGSYYELIRDHIAYYTFSSLRRLFEETGFRVLEEETVNRDTIAMIVQKVPDGGEERVISAGTAAKKEDGLVQALVEGYEITQEEIRSLIRECRAQNSTLSVWGASHQGFTLLSTTELSDYVTSVVDSAPFKQGRFAPASHVPIVSPEEFFAAPADVCLITAPGYSAEIAGIIRERAGGNVRVLTIRSSRIENV